jgi:hypothetical protein
MPRLTPGSLHGSRRRAALVGLLCAALPGCYDFHKTGPVEPDPVPLPETVSVTVEYVQSGSCKAPNGCSDGVVVFGSWMRPGAEIQLTSDPGNRIWVGTLTGVPVNYPPAGDPYKIRIYDPFLQDGGATRYTGHRLTLGGQLLTDIQVMDSRDQAALAYVDSNGFGHNPF